MMALEFPDTKWPGWVIQPDPARPSRHLGARRPDRSDTCSLVMMLDTSLCTVSGLTPKRLATPASSARGEQPPDPGLTFDELGKWR
jgi:hypothetical protein